MNLNYFVNSTLQLYNNSFGITLKKSGIVKIVYYVSFVLYNTLKQGILQTHKNRIIKILNHVLSLGCLFF